VEIFAVIALKAVVRHKYISLEV